MDPASNSSIPRRRPRRRAARRWAIVLGVLALAGALVLPSCGQLGMFLEWPRTATVPESDWAEAAVELERIEAPHPTLEGMTVSAVRAGDPGGRRVVFVHGSPGSSSNWAPFLEAVPAGYEFVSVDRPGFGFTEPVRSVASLADQAAALLPFLDTPDGRPVVLVGWSYGGPVIARAAVDYPNRVAGLVIVAGALDPDLEHVRFLQHVGNAWPFNRFVRDTWRIANEELIPLERELRDLEPLLAEIACPVHVLHGERDSLVPFANVAFMESAFTGTDDLRLVTFENERHFLPFSQPGAILGSIDVVTEGGGALR